MCAPLASATRTDHSWNAQCPRMATVSGVAPRDLSAMAPRPSLSLLTVDDGHQDTAPVPQSSDRVGMLGATNLGSWRTTDASTRESSSATTSCTSWFSPAARSPAAALPDQPCRGMCQTGGGETKAGGGDTTATEELSDQGPVRKLDETVSLWQQVEPCLYLTIVPHPGVNAQLKRKEREEKRREEEMKN